MNREDILKILSIIDASNVVEYKENIQCSCLLAEWRGGHSLGSDHAGSMGISIDYEGVSKVHCFSCGFSGTLERTVRLLSKYTKRDLSDVLKTIHKLEEPDIEDIANSVGSYTTIGEQLSLDSLERPRFLGECLLRILFEPGAHRYLIDRGFSIETLKAWECYYDEKRRRVVFPVRSQIFHSDHRVGNLVGAVGRAVFDSSIKYYNYFEFAKSKFLYGEHLCRKARAVVVVEGILDTIAVWRLLKDSGYYENISVVGLFGSNASNHQIARIQKDFDEVILFLDNDPAGWTGQRALAKALQRKMLVRAVRYPQRFIGDPDQLIRQGEDVVSLIMNADLILV